MQELQENMEAAREQGGGRAEMILFTNSDFYCCGSLLVLPHTSYVTLGALLSISEPHNPLICKMELG